MDTATFLFAFGLTLLAGLSTGLGATLAFFVKGGSPRFLSLALGFSAGVMLYVAFMEILPEAQKTMGQVWGEQGGKLGAAAAFFAGMLLIALIEKLIPGGDHHHTPPHPLPVSAFLNHTAGSPPCAPTHTSHSLHRMGVFTAMALAVHNLPEGFAIFTMATADPHLGVSIAIAIATHNIPMGIAVSVPIYYATGSKTKAFALSLFAGLAQPAGALVGFVLLNAFMTPLLLGTLCALVAGVLVFVSLDELLPKGEAYGEHHLCIYGLVSGMAVMALSLILLA